MSVKNPPKEFPEIDAYTTFMPDENAYYYHCNYCSTFHTKEYELILNHFDLKHGNLRDARFSTNRYINKITGKTWFIPKPETIEHSSYPYDAGNPNLCYIKFYATWVNDEKPLTPDEQKNVKRQINPPWDWYYVEPSIDWNIPDSTLSAKPDKSVLKRITELESRLTHLEKFLTDASSSPQSPPENTKQRKRKLYTLNAKSENLDKYKQTIMKKHNIPDSDIVIIKNRYGNYAIFYYK